MSDTGWSGGSSVMIMLSTLACLPACRRTPEASYITYKKRSYKLDPHQVACITPCNTSVYRAASHMAPGDDQIERLAQAPRGNAALPRSDAHSGTARRYTGCRARTTMENTSPTANASDPVPLITPMAVVKPTTCRGMPLNVDPCIQSCSQQLVADHRDQVRPLLRDLIRAWQRQIRGCTSTA